MIRNSESRTAAHAGGLRNEKPETAERYGPETGSCELKTRFPLDYELWTMDKLFFSRYQVETDGLVWGYS
jgi:hypothetical protein